MTLASGTKLGPYEILSPLGAGGMGEVYRARDSKLRRDVAIKVLPESLAQDPDALARFEREAHAIAALNHPSILSIFDFATHDGTAIAVMELLEGAPLREKLDAGPLPVRRAVEIAIQIAHGLAAAHGKGVVHRDLKPDNVFVIQDGRVKILDFGLARMAAPAGEHVSSLATETSAGRPLTAAGTVMGTVGYMSPEQVRGRDVDARTDIFSFGALLYEMLTGRRAFRGESAADTMSAILNLEPLELLQSGRGIPPALDRIVRHCLEKSPAARFQSAGDIAFALESITSDSSASEIPPSPSGPRSARRPASERLAWGAAVLAAAVAAVAVAAALRSGNRAAALERPVRASIVLPEKTALRHLVLSPDGRRLAFVARDAAGQSRLWIRRLDSADVEALPETEGATFPFWSPDGQFVAFFSAGKLKRMDASGGPPQVICDAPLSRGGAWGDGVIVFAPTVDGGLFRVSPSGGAPSRLTSLDPARKETSHRFPVFLPDGRRFLYLVADFATASRGDVPGMGIYVRSIDSKEERFVCPSRSSAVFAPASPGSTTGSLLVLRDGNLFAQAFDAKSARVAGDPVPIAESVQYFPQTQAAIFSASADGTLVYQSRSTPGVAQLVWYDRSGKVLETLGAPANQANPRISPDGKRVALDITDPQSGNTDIWIYEASGGVPTRITTDPALDTSPIWSSDGRRLVFMSLRGSHPDLYERNASGAGGDALIFTAADSEEYPMSESSDGRFILFREITDSTNFGLSSLPVGGKRATPFLKASFGFSDGAFSPDGRWVAYASNESGRWEVYVAPFPGPGGNWKISSGGGTEPRWRADGKELFYLAADGRLMAAAVKEGPPFEAAAAEVLFQTHQRERIASTDIFSYDVSPDGQRFLVNTDSGETTSSPLNLVLHWTPEPRR